MKKQGSFDGVSPVVSVILLVGITVALVALVSTIAFNSVDQIVSEKADASVDLRFNQDINGSRIGYLNATVVTNKNVQSIVIETPSGNTTVVSNRGDTAQLVVYQEGEAYARASDTNFDQIITRIKIQKNP